MYVLGSRFEVVTAIDTEKGTIKVGTILVVKDYVVAGALGFSGKKSKTAPKLYLLSSPSNSKLSYVVGHWKLSRFTRKIT